MASTLPQWVQIYFMWRMSSARLWTGTSLTTQLIQRWYYNDIGTQTHIFIYQNRYLDTKSPFPHPPPLSPPFRSQAHRPHAHTAVISKQQQSKQVPFYSIQNQLAHSDVVYDLYRYPLINLLSMHAKFYVCGYVRTYVRTPRTSVAFQKTVKKTAPFTPSLPRDSPSV